MSRRTIISLCASAVLGIGCLAMVSTDASAYRGRGGVHRAGVHHGGAYRGAYRAGAYRGYRAGVYRGAAVRRGVAVGVGAAAVGAAAYGAYGGYGAYRCGYYPYGPCYYRRFRRAQQRGRRATSHSCTTLNRALREAAAGGEPRSASRKAGGSPFFG